MTNNKALIAVVVVIVAALLVLAYYKSSHAQTSPTTTGLQQQGSSALGSNPGAPALNQAAAANLTSPLNATPIQDANFTSSENVSSSP